MADMPAPAYHSMPDRANRLIVAHEAIREHARARAEKEHERRHQAHRKMEVEQGLIMGKPASNG